MKYEEFLRQKEIVDRPSGFEINIKSLNKNLFDWQKVIVKWALARGRSALFEGCGLGKTIQQLAWADCVVQYAKAPVLILAPLAVTEQTKHEGKKFGIDVNICAKQSDIRSGVNITNYQKLHKFNVDDFAGIVLDESGILKNFAGATRNEIIGAFYKTPYRLACTATPAPNDWMELGNHAEFLGVMSRTEMLATFFINDTGDTGTWRLKGHVGKNIFWQWLSSWSIMLSSPQDMGFDDHKGFNLPPITFHEHIVKTSAKPTRGFFVTPVSDLNSRRKVRNETIDIRCKKAAELINATDDTWAVWSGLNAESDLLSQLIDSAVEVAGKHSDEQKSQRMLDFANGKIKRIVTKPSIAGHGMNWQVCHKAAFVGLSDSWESFYQSVRRIWRFGQKHPVEIHIFLEEREGPILRNIAEKEKRAQEMMTNMLLHMNDLLRQKIAQSVKNTIEYNADKKMELPKWLSSMSQN